ncbi:MAG: hypothetical protein GXO32_03360 [Crenarchaeota archaeon]|nr:hypothetical protein [Thermoproteota archaeon]
MRAEVCDGDVCWCAGSEREALGGRVTPGNEDAGRTVESSERKRICEEKSYLDAFDSQ